MIQTTQTPTNAVQPVSEDTVERAFSESGVVIPPFAPSFIEMLDKLGVREKATKLFHDIVKYQVYNTLNRQRDIAMFNEWVKTYESLGAKGEQKDLEALKNALQQEIYKVSDPQTSGAVEQQRLMMQIVQHMKEIPELPSEAPKDVSRLETVHFGANGGVYTKMEGHPLPYKGFPFFEFVERIDFMKKVSRGVLSGLYHEVKDRKLSLVFLVPAFWALKPLIRAVIYSFYRIAERSRLKTQMYSTPIRELYRSFGNSEGTRQRIRDLTCMILEFDNAYRFRMQDIVPELDKTSLKKNPVKEILRLLDIMTSREKGQDIKDTWRLLKYFVRFYLRFDSEIKNIITDVLSEINVEEVKLDDSDKHFCEKRTDYTFAFMDKLWLDSQNTITHPSLSQKQTPQLPPQPLGLPIQVSK